MPKENVIHNKNSEESKSTNKNISNDKNNKNDKNHMNNRNDKNNKYNRNNTKYDSKASYQKSSVPVMEKPNHHLIMVFIILCILPLIVRLKIYDPQTDNYPWLVNTDNQFDFFLYYKHLVFIYAAAIMAILIAYKAYREKRAMKFTPIFFPLIIYVALALLSSVFSDYVVYSFSGGTEQFESIYVLIGYGIVAYYGFLFVNTERDLRWVTTFLIMIALVFSILGVFQFLGRDFFATDMAYRLTVPVEVQNLYRFDFVFGEKIVYLTLYNPNYVGVYSALVIPVLLTMVFFHKKVIWIILSLLSVVGLIICTIGAQSLASVIGLGAALFFILVFMWRYLLKRFYITIPVVITLLVTLILINNATDQRLLNKLTSAFKVTKNEYALTNLETRDDHVTLTYNNYELNVKYIFSEGQDISFDLTDDKGEVIPVAYDAASNLFTVADERFQNIVLGMDTEYYGAFNVSIEGVNYRFIKQMEDGKYYYINQYNRLDKMITAPSSVFTGYEGFASSRGLIWAKTIPLLKKYAILGSGADTFMMVFPQQDYMNLKRFSDETAVITKPHSLYLQMAIQTGGLSLIAFLVFYGMYFISSIRLYIRGRFTSLYAKMGIAIFIGSLAYMVTGLTNDSTITVAPTYWLLIGIGIGVNIKAKPLIKQEIEEIKARKIAARTAES